MLDLWKRFDRWMNADLYRAEQRLDATLAKLDCLIAELDATIKR